MKSKKTSSWTSGPKHKDDKDVLLERMRLRILSILCADQFCGFVNVQTLNVLLQLKSTVGFVHLASSCYRKSDLRFSAS